MGRISLAAVLCVLSIGLLQGSAWACCQICVGYPDGCASDCYAGSCICTWDGAKCREFYGCICYNGKCKCTRGTPNSETDVAVDAKNHPWLSDKNFAKVVGTYSRPMERVIPEAQDQLVHLPKVAESLCRGEVGGSLTDFERKTNLYYRVVRDGEKWTITVTEKTWIEVQRLKPHLGIKDDNTFEDETYNHPQETLQLNKMGWSLSSAAIGFVAAGPFR